MSSYGEEDFAVLRGAGRMVIVKSIFNCGEQIVTLWNWLSLYAFLRGREALKYCVRVAVIVKYVKIVCCICCMMVTYLHGARDLLCTCPGESKSKKIGLWFWREGGICNRDILINKISYPNAPLQSPSGKFSMREKAGTLAKQPVCEGCLEESASGIRVVLSCLVIMLYFRNFGDIYL